MVKKKIFNYWVTLILDLVPSLWAFCHQVLTSNWISIFWILCLGGILNFRTTLALNLVGYSAILLYDSKFTIIPGLQNTLAIWHPFAVLYFYSSLISLSLTQTRIIGRTFLSFGTSALAIVLGGLWAYQEFTWGGWWNWDGVEVPIGLLWCFAVYKLLHVKTVGWWYKYKWVWLVGLATLSVIIYIRFVTTTSVHSFVTLNGVYTIYSATIIPIAYLKLIIFLNLQFYVLTNLKYLVLGVLYIFITQYIVFMYRSYHVMWEIIIVFMLGFNWSIVFTPTTFMCYSNKTFTNTSNELVLWCKPATTHFYVYENALSNLIN